MTQFLYSSKVLLCLIWGFLKLGLCQNISISNDTSGSPSNFETTAKSLSAVNVEFFKATEERDGAVVGGSLSTHSGIKTMDMMGMSRRKPTLAADSAKMDPDVEVFSEKAMENKVPPGLPEKLGSSNMIKPTEYPMFSWWTGKPSIVPSPKPEVHDNEGTTTAEKAEMDPVTTTSSPMSETTTERMAENCSQAMSTTSTMRAPTTPEMEDRVTTPKTTVVSILPPSDTTKDPHRLKKKLVQIAKVVGKAALGQAGSLAASTADRVIPVAKDAARQAGILALKTAGNVGSFTKNVAENAYDNLAKKLNVTDEEFVGGSSGNNHQKPPQAQAPRPTTTRAPFRVTKRTPPPSFANFDTSDAFEYADEDCGGGLCKVNQYLLLVLLGCVGIFKRLL